MSGPVYTLLQRAGMWALTLAVLGGLFWGAYHLDQERRRNLKESEKEKDAAASGDKQGPAFVKMDKEYAKAFIKDEKVQPIEKWQPQLAVFGRVVSDPRTTAEIRAAFAGKLRPGKDPWPLLTQRVAAGQQFGWLDIRVGPQERLDLQSKQKEAAINFEGAQKILTLRQDRVDRLKKFGVSQNELDVALVDLAESKTKLKVAESADKLWREAIDSLKRQIQDTGSDKDLTFSQPILAPAAGEIIEMAVRPGMVVEAGGVLARTADFSKVLVRLDVPLSVLKEQLPGTLDVFVLSSTPAALEGANNRQEESEPPLAIKANLLGIAPQTDAASQFAGCLYEADNPPGFCRPGLFVKAMLRKPEAKPIEDTPLSIVSIPDTALLYHQGRPMVYVVAGVARYQRKEVQLLARSGRRWIVKGVDEDESVVSEGAQAILSAEFLQAVDND